LVQYRVKGLITVTRSERERARDGENVYPERRIIVAEKKNAKGAYENMRRNGRVFRHMCFVSVELATRQTRTGAVCQHRTQRTEQWFAVAVRRTLQEKRLEDALFLHDLLELVMSWLITKPTALQKY